jgi:hypothetical protein
MVVDGLGSACVAESSFEEVHPGKTTMPAIKNPNLRRCLNLTFIVLQFSGS